MPRYLGIDHGKKRLGLAVSDADGRMATPLGQLDCVGRPQEDLEQLRGVIADYDIEAVVLGLPLNMDGSESEQSRLARQFGTRLEQALGLPLEYWDERLSSHAADGLLDQREELTKKKRKARRDALAAQIILQGFLDSRTNREPGVETPG